MDKKEKKLSKIDTENGFCFSVKYKFRSLCIACLYLQFILFFL